MTYIGYDYNGFPISIVVAASRKLATAYWQGAGILPHSSKCVEKDFPNIQKHLTGVFPILQTSEFSGHELEQRFKRHSFDKFRMISK